ncbi:MAG: hypothetical protein NC201_06695 [Prevotella sp.]|nr:hypothetical protein [Bacteroides sp.]MCM1366916.1 hypothetical protein [Prevotella sp.]
MVRNSIKRYGSAVAFIAAATLLFLTGCFTGIEGTKKVKLSREDRKVSQPSEEEKLNALFSADTLKDWNVGKNFIVTNHKVEIVLRSIGDKKYEISDTLVYKGIVMRPSPSGEQTARLLFADSRNEWEYDTGKSYSAARMNLSSMDIPMIIDVDFVENVGKILNNKKLYIRTSDWQDSEGNQEKGLKYSLVTIKSVTAGNEQFPLKVGFQTNDELIWYVMMSSGKKSTDSRSFPILFSFEDVKNSYRNISQEVWALIQQSKVTIGMTKEECRLSLGTPASVSSGRDYAKVFDLWSYGDGKYLKFEDGILVDFRL